MELRQLRYFLAVAEEENFTRAARRMHVAQTGISQQIRRLELDLGEQLFDRSTHHVRLTQAGRALVPHARAALAATDAGRTALAELRGLVRGTLHLGIIQGLPDIDLAGLLAGFHARYDGVEVTLREEQSDLLIDDLQRGAYDVAIVGLSEPHPPPGLSIDIISIEPLVLVTSVRHPPIETPPIAIDHLRAHPLVTLIRGSGLRRHLETACAAAGFAPRIAFEVSDVRLLTDLVAHGLGVTIVPRSIAQSGTSRWPLRLDEIDLPLRRCVALAWRTQGPRAATARAFIDLARSTLVMRATEAPVS